MPATRYLIGLGSNRRHGRHGAPHGVIAAAVAAIASKHMKCLAVSPTMRSAAIGPSNRDFANAAMLVRTKLDPPALLAKLKKIERRFGRRAGQRWGARVLDLDILAWSAGTWPRGLRQAAPHGLAVPHYALAERDFAIGPAASLVPGWRHPRRGVTLRQLDARRRKAHAVDPRRAGQ